MEGYTRLPENVQFRLGAFGACAAGLHEHRSCDSEKPFPLSKIVNPGDVFIGPTVQNEREQVENGSNRAWRIMGGMAVFLIFWFWLIFQVNSASAP